MVNFLELNLFQVKLFLTLAETLSFTQAARQCSVTQSAMSRNIKSLETALGIRLFERSTSSVRLTPAGESVYRDWKLYYTRMEDAVLKGVAIQTGKQGYLRIGISGIISIMPELQPFLRLYRQENPETELVFSHCPDLDFRGCLARKEVDVLFGITYDKVEPEGFCRMVITQVPTVVYMLKSNPLAQKEAISIADLAEQNILVHVAQGEKRHTEYFGSLLGAHGLQPRLKGIFSGVDDMLLNLTDDSDVFISTRFHPERFNPMYCRKEIAEPAFPLCLFWRKESKQNPIIKEFLRAFEHQGINCFAENIEGII